MPPPGHVTARTRFTLCWRTPQIVTRPETRDVAYRTPTAAIGLGARHGGDSEHQQQAEWRASTTHRGPRRLTTVLGPLAASGESEEKPRCRRRFGKDKR